MRRPLPVLQATILVAALTISVVPASAQAPATADPFGAEVTLPEKDIVFLKGNGTWDSAFDTLLEAFKKVYSFLEKQGVAPAGPAMTIYTSTDDTGFQYQAGVPVASALANPPTGDIQVGKSPTGKALEFIHRGSYDAMDNTYEAITNHLDEKRLEAKDMFIEEYETDLRTTAEDKLIIHVFVPLK